METQRFESTQKTNDDVPSLLKIEYKIDDLEKEITNLSIQEARCEVEVERLEKLSDIKRSDLKLLKYYSPVVLIPASIAGIAAAIVSPSVAASIVLAGASTVGAIHSLKVVSGDYPKITKGRTKNVFAALKELNKKRREVLGEYLAVSTELDAVRENKASTYKELDSMQEYRRDVMHMIQEKQQKEYGVEEEPLFVEVVEQYRNEQSKVKKLK